MMDTILTRAFVCREWEVTGELGWKPEWIPNFDPLAGMAVPHDVMEHFPDSGPEIHHELQAFGAMYFIRGEMDYWGQAGMNPDPFFHMTGGIVQVFEEDMHNKNGGRGFVWPAPAAATSGDPDLDESFYNLACRGIRDFVSEMDAVDGWDFKSPVKAGQVAPWIAIGYARAVERFKHTSQDELVHTFREVEKAADRYLADCYGDERLVIAFNETRGTAKIRFQEFEEEAA